MSLTSPTSGGIGEDVHPPRLESAAFSNGKIPPSFFNTRWLCFAVLPDLRTALSIAKDNSCSFGMMAHNQGTR
jgi:hypothetical protein